MSRPPVNPEKSLAGIALDPISLERVIPESKRPDGTVRKQLKIRPGFTPQEDVRRFRGTKQAQMDSNALPKGHVIGWAPPPGSNTGTNNSNEAASSSGTTPMTKAAKKNAKRKEKRDKEKAGKDKEEVPDNWEDDDEQVEEKKTTGGDKGASAQQSVEDNLSSQLEKLDVN